MSKRQSLPALGSRSGTRVTLDKNSFLARFKDKEEDIHIGDPVNNNSQDRNSKYLLDDIDELEEFKTLTLNEHNLNTLKGDKPSSNEIRKLNEEGTEGNHFNDVLELDLPDGFKSSSIEDLRWSPGTISTSSPKKFRRRSLSEYSEGTADTDLTEINDEDFANIDQVDDIFGAEESGIYNTTKASAVLNLQKQKQKIDANIEEKDLMKRYRNNKEKEVSTLKLVDHKYYENNVIDSDALANERTIDYDYTRDDLEDFEEGFDLASPIKLKIANNKNFSSTLNLNSKVSLPSFALSKMPENNNNASLRRHKSSAAFTQEYINDKPMSSQDRLMKKLNRISSFHAERNSFDSINRGIEIEKKKLLEKYMEISEKQYRLQRKSRNKKLQQGDSLNLKSRKNIGIIRYLNENVDATSVHGNMKFNPKSHVWDGNEIELMKFENLNTVRPQLIPAHKYKSSSRETKRQGNMMYDPEKLKWVNLDKEEDAFKDLPDLEDSTGPTRKSSFYPTKDLGRGVSTFTQRTESTSSTKSSTLLDEFSLPVKLIDRFYQQEKKSRRKVGYWFQHDENYQLNVVHYNRDYLWEIRKLVVDDED